MHLNQDSVNYNNKLGVTTLVLKTRDYISLGYPRGKAEAKVFPQVHIWSCASRVDEALLPT